jgi:hypothetical protein
MKEKGFTSIQDLAEKIDALYESVRRVVMGTHSPSKHLLSEFCKVLNLPKHEMELLVEQDKIKTKMGKAAFSTLSGMHEGVEVINDLWEAIPPERQKDLQEMARMWSQTQRFAKGRRTRSA